MEKSTVANFAIKVNLPCSFVLLHVVREETFISSGWIFTLSFPLDQTGGREAAVLCSPSSPAPPVT